MNFAISSVFLGDRYFELKAVLLHVNSGNAGNFAGVFVGVCTRTKKRSKCSPTVKICTKQWTPHKVRQNVNRQILTADQNLIARVIKNLTALGCCLASKSPRGHILTAGLHLTALFFLVPG